MGKGDNQTTMSLIIYRKVVTKISTKYIVAITITSKNFLLSVNQDRKYADGCRSG